MQSPSPVPSAPTAPLGAAAALTMTQREYWLDVAVRRRIPLDQIEKAWNTFTTSRDAGVTTTGNVSVFGSSFLYTLATTFGVSGEVIGEEMAARRGWIFQRMPVVDQDAFGVLSKVEWRRYYSIPVVDATDPSRRGAAVIVACMDPEMVAFAQFRQKVQSLFGSRPVEWRIASYSDIVRCLDRPAQAYQATAAAGSEGEVSLDMIEADLAQAFRLGASDLHAECIEAGLVVRIRVDGALEELKRHPVSLRATYIAQLKLASGRRGNMQSGTGMDSGQNALSQDASTAREWDGKRVALRFSGSPSAWGYNIVVRFIDQSSIQLLRLSDLGYRRSVEQRLQQAFRGNTSLNAICGTTGSGKSTTLYCGLRTIDLSSKKVVTIENPIEVRFPEGLDQREVTIQEGFAEQLRHILRQDPDVIVPAETRDKEVLALLLQGTHSGHLSWTTLHVDNPFLAVHRIIGWKVQPGEFADFLRFFCAQRLARRLCPHCRQPDPMSGDYLAAYAELLAAHQDDLRHLLKGREPGFFTAREGGCPHCRGKGTKGRILFSEGYLFGKRDVVQILAEGENYNAGAARDAARRRTVMARQRCAQARDALAQLQGQGTAPDALRAAQTELVAANRDLAEELTTMREDAILKAAAGLVSMAAVFEDTEPDEPLTP